ncbi:hypothetical protein EK599_14030 [Vibrio sp. T187]|uniref:J domain-containing protein n=1 Tax=Vibrio TaxID=662 RepID=UPI0010C9CCF3|nr:MULTISPECIES: SEL1-like repeat protein [Vibrio]MBW3696814.1 hypothetical protein [Vibrio sp. T187]
MFKFIVSTLFLISATLAHADTIASLTEQAQQQDPESQYLLAQSYDLGVDIEENKENAFYWYSQAAQNGQLNAQSKLAYFLAKGIGTEKDIDEAIRWYSQLAAQGNTQAPLQLARLYETYQGSIKPLDMAEIWYQIANQSNPDAEEGYSRVLEAKFNARRAKQISSIEQLDVAFTEIDEPELNDAAPKPAEPKPQFATSDYLSVAVLVLLTSALIVVVKRTRRKKSTQKLAHQQQIEAQLKSSQFTIKQQKRQLEAMFREVKKQQASSKTQKLKVACALFGYTPSSIPAPKQIKIRYKQLSKLYHPDLHGSDEEMKRLNAALKTISQNVTTK